MYEDTDWWSFCLTWVKCGSCLACQQKDKIRKPGSSLSTVTGYVLMSGMRFAEDKFSPLFADRLWEPSSIPSKGHEAAGAWNWGCPCYLLLSGHQGIFYVWTKQPKCKANNWTQYAATPPLGFMVWCLIRHWNLTYIIKKNTFPQYTSEKFTYFAYR